MSEIIKRETTFAVAALLLFAGVVWLFYRMMAPFLAPIAWGAILVVTVQPLHTRLCKRFRRRGIPALLMTLLVAIVIIVPVILLGFSLVDEASGLYARVQEAVGTQGVGWPDLRQLPWVQSLTGHLEGVVDLSGLDINKAVLDVLGRVSSFIVSHATSLLTNIGRTMLQFLLVLLTMYYLFKDGDGLLKLMKESIPLPSARSEKILAHITNVVRATIYGGLAVSAFQGIMGGLMFWIMGVPSPVFWGAVMAVLTLIPLLGAYIVYLPAAAFLVSEGSIIKGIILAAWGVGVVSQIDNFLTPMLLSGRTRLHPILLFFSIMGGLLHFGFLGLVLGPVVASVFVAVFDLYRDAIRDPVQDAG
jgi:predicted PurR-regulated permease PerM